MEPSKSLTTALLRSELLPDTEPPLKFKNFDSFEKAIIEHISNKKDQRNYIWFDLECIEDEHSYESLFAELIEAANAAEMIEEYRIFTDFVNQLTSCTVIKDGESLQSSWSQSSDWVEDSFLDFSCAVLKSSKGQFINIETNDQTCLLIFIPNGAHKSYLAYRKRAKKSRESFFQTPQAKSIYGHIPILDSRLFTNAIDRLKSNAEISVDLLDLCPSDKGHFISLMLETKKFSEYAYANATELGCEYVAIVEDLDFSDLMMDDECYLLVTSNLQDKVIFSFQAKDIYNLGFWTDAVYRQFLAIDKSFQWGVLCKKGVFFFIGEEAISQAKSYSIHVKELQADN